MFMSSLKTGTPTANGGVISEEHRQYLRCVRRRRLMVMLTRTIVFVGLFVFWEAAARQGWVNSFISSSPSRAFAEASRLVSRGELWTHLGMTVGETVVGFTVGTILGIGMAVVLWWSDFASKVLEPYIVIANSIPKVALGPIFIVWLGTNVSAIIAMALAISVIVAVMTVYSGFREVDPNKIKLMTTFGATKGQILRKLILPASVPTMMSALKVNVGLSLVGTIMGEFLVSKAGLGFLIIYGGQVFNMSLVMSSVIILCIVSALLYYAVTILERKVTRGRSGSNWA